MLFNLCYDFTWYMRHDDSYGNIANPMVLLLRFIPSLERLVVIFDFCKQDSL